MENKSINTLDDDCLLKIFSYFSISTLIQAQKVCRRWEILCEESWKAVESFYCEGRNWYLMKKQDYHRYKVRNINDLQTIFKYCGAFVKFYSLSCTREHFNDVTLKNLSTTVAKQCKSITEICIKVPDSKIPIDSLLNNYTNLVKLTLEQIKENMQENISILLNKNKQLKCFSLKLLNYQSDCNKVDGMFLKCLPNDLEELNFNQCDSVEWINITDIIEKCNCLRTFSYNCSYWPRDFIMNIIGKKQTLINVSLRSLYITKPSSFDNLANLVNLQTLNLAFNMSLHDENLEKIVNNCRLLKTLDVSHCYELTNRGIAKISQLTDLEELRMINMGNVTDEPIGNFPNTLKHLSCSACRKLGNDGLIKLLRRAPNLNTLNVSECFNVTGHLIEVAIEVTGDRANNVLKIYVCCSRAGMYACDLKKLYGENVTTMWPFLKILYSVRSDCNKGTECNCRSM